MESRLIQSNRGMVLEILLDSSGADRVEVARMVEALHGLRPGQARIEFLNASTTEAT
jgi:hypothetical protein